MAAGSSCTRWVAASVNNDYPRNSSDFGNDWEYFPIEDMKGYTREVLKVQSLKIQWRKHKVCIESGIISNPEFGE